MASECFLKFEWCECNPFLKTHAETMCSCRENYVLKCVRVCGDCRGDNGRNVEEIVIDNEDNIDIEGERFNIDDGSMLQ